MVCCLLKQKSNFWRRLTRAKFPAIYKCPIRVAFYMEITFQDKERKSRSEVHCSWCALLFLFHLKTRAVLSWERENNIWIQMSPQTGASLKVKYLSCLSPTPVHIKDKGKPDTFRLKLSFVKRFLIINLEGKKTPTEAAYIRNVGIWARLLFSLVEVFVSKQLQLERQWEQSAAYTEVARIRKISR